MEELLDGIRRGRVHEATGPGRRGFAAALGSRFAGPLIWIARAGAEGLNPWGLAAFLAPERLITVRPDTEAEVFWCMEEALRSGAAPLVVAETGRPADLTRSRRLQLAAEAGPATGLCLFAGRAVANASETRWHAAPLPAPGWELRQEWTCLKDKRARTGCWQVTLKPGGGPGAGGACAGQGLYPRPWRPTPPLDATE